MPEVHSIIRLENSEDNTSTRIVGAGTFLFQGSNAFAQKDSGYSGQPLSLLAWHPFLDKATWIYVADSEKSRRINVGGTDVKVGIDRPGRGGTNSEYAGMQTPTLAAATIDTLYNLATGNDATAQTDWNSNDADFAITGTTETITSQKPTRVATGGSLNNVGLSLITAGVANTTQIAVAGHILSSTKDWKTGFSQESRVEMFVKMSNLATQNFLRVALSLEAVKTGMTYADNGSGAARVTLSAHGYKSGDAVIITGATETGNDDVNGHWFITQIDANDFDLIGSTIDGAVPTGGSVVNFSKNAYYSDITPSELASSGDLSQELLTSRQQDFADEARLRKEFEDYKRFLLSLGIKSARERAERMTFQEFLDNYQGDRKESIASDEWFVFSRPKSAFLRSGNNPDLNWADITAISLGVQFNDEAVGGGAGKGAAVSFSQIDMVKSESILNSKLGGAPYDWRFTYFESSTGVESNPSPIMPEGIEVVQQKPTLTLAGVGTTIADKIRIWRRGGMLRSWHLVDTINNPGNGSTTTYVDSKDDLEIASNLLLDQDNYPPLPLPVEVTQLLKFSENFADATWVKTNASVNSNVQRAPDFSETADEVIASSADGEINQAVTSTSKTTYFSIYLKAKSVTGSGPHVTLYNTISSDQETDVTLATPMFDPIEGGDVGVWERFVITCNSSTTDVGIKIVNNGDEVYVWGAQLESWDATAGFIEPARYTPDLEFQETRRTSREVVLGEEGDDTFLGTMQVDDTNTVITAILESGGAPENWWGPYANSILAIRGNKDSELVNAGRLYWSKAGKPDQWRPQDNIEVSGGGEPLQRGFIYNTRPYVFSVELLYAINVNPAGRPRFVAWPTPVSEGLWRRYALAVGPKIWWLAKDGIYESNGSAARNITTPSLIRPLFEGESVSGLSPVDMTADQDELRLEWHAPHLFFFYKDTAGARNTLVYHPELNRWGHWKHNKAVRMGYSEAETRNLLFGTEDGFLLLHDGAKDDHGNAISGEIRTGALDQDLPHTDKTYGDVHIEATIPSGTTVTAAPFTDDELTTESTQSLVGTGARKRFKLTLGLGKVARSLSFGFTNITHDGTDPVILHQIDIAYQEHQIKELHWDSNFENDGSLEDKWITGLYLECDTGGVNKAIAVQVDGAAITGSPFTINSNGVKPVKISWEPVRGVSMRFTSTAVEGSLWGWRWIWKEEPVHLQEPFAWDNLGWDHGKFVKGFSITADSFGQAVTLELRSNGDETTNASGSDTFVFAHSGPSTAEFSLTAQVLADLVRLTNTTTNPLRVYSIKWIFDQEPISYKLWRTQERSFAFGGWGHLRDGYIAISSGADVTLTITIDGTAQAGITLSSTSGNRRKIYFQALANKGKVYQFSLTSANDFKIYNEDTAVFVKPWNSSVGYKRLQLPFEGGTINP